MLILFVLQLVVTFVRVLTYFCLAVRVAAD
jgi:hypothetical protein